MESFSNRSYHSIENELSTLLQINKTYSTFHKIIINALQSSEFVSGSDEPNIGNAKVILDIKTLNLLIESSKSLIETDILHTHTLKSLNSSINIFGRSFQLSISIKQDIDFIKSTLKSFQCFFNDSCKRLMNFTQNYQKNPKFCVEDSFKKGIKIILSTLLPQSLFEQKVPNLEERILSLFQFENNEKWNQLIRVKKLKEHSDGLRNIILQTIKDLTKVYWGSISNDSTLCEKKTENEIESKQKRKSSEKVFPRRSLTKEEEKALKVKLKKKALSPLNLLGIREDDLSDGPVTETRIKPGVNKSEFDSNIDKVLGLKKKINKSYSNLKSRKPSNKSFQKNSSNLHIRSNRSSSKPS